MLQDITYILEADPYKAWLFVVIMVLLALLATSRRNKKDSDNMGEAIRLSQKQLDIAEKQVENEKKVIVAISTLSEQLDILTHLKMKFHDQLQQANNDQTEQIIGAMDVHHVRVLEEFQRLAPIGEAAATLLIVAAEIKAMAEQLSTMSLNESKIITEE